jgi:uncharacterized C2H2 Zn-finger protein
MPRQNNLCFQTVLFLLLLTAREGRPSTESNVVPTRIGPVFPRAYVPGVMADVCTHAQNLSHQRPSGLRGELPLRCFPRCRSAMIQAQGHQIRHIRFAHAHNCVRASPIDLDGSIGFGHGATGKHDIVNVSRDFPGWA